MRSLLHNFLLSPFFFFVSLFILCFPIYYVSPPPLCLGRQPVIFAVPLIALSLILVRRRFNARRSPSLPRLAASPFLLLLSSPPFFSPRLLSLLVRWRFYAKRSVAPY